MRGKPCLGSAIRAAAARVTSAAGGQICYPLASQALRFDQRGVLVMPVEEGGCLKGLLPLHEFLLCFVLAEPERSLKHRLIHYLCYQSVILLFQIDVV